MKYHELICKYFGEYAEDVLKLEKLILAGDKELASYISTNIPNYEKKMLEVFKEYYPTYGDYIKGIHTEIGDSVLLQFFFSYHLAENLHKISFGGVEYDGEWVEGYSAFFSKELNISVELPLYIKTFDTIFFNWCGNMMESMTIVNASELQVLYKLSINHKVALNINDLPNPTTLSIIYWEQPPVINGVKEFYNKITKLTMENIGFFGEEHQDYIFRFNNLKELEIVHSIPIDTIIDLKLPCVPSLKINEVALPNSKNAFNNILFVVVEYFTLPLSHKKMLDVGFEYESTRQHNSHYFVTYKNTRF